MPVKNIESMNKIEETEEGDTSASQIGSLGAIIGTMSSACDSTTSGTPIGMSTCNSSDFDEAQAPLALLGNK